MQSGASNRFFIMKRLVDSTSEVAPAVGSGVASAFGSGVLAAAFDN